MNKQLTLFITFLTVVLFISSCSIEKRMHRPGYHIEWKKSYQDINQEGTDKNPFVEEAQSSTPIVNQDFTIDPIENPDSYNLIQQNAGTEKPETEVEMNAAASSNENVSTTIENGKESILKKSIIKAEKKGNPFQDSDNKRAKGIYMMLLALAFFALGYLFFTILGVFGLILFWIFGIAAAIYFVIGLIFVIIG